MCTHIQWCAYGSFRGQLSGFGLCPSTLSRKSFFCCFCQSLYSTLAGRLLSNPLASVSYLAVNLLELQAHTAVFSFMWVPMNLGHWACVASAFTHWAISLILFLIFWETCMLISLSGCTSWHPHQHGMNVPLLSHPGQCWLSSSFLITTFWMGEMKFQSTLICIFQMAKHVEH